MDTIKNNIPGISKICLVFLLILVIDFGSFVEATEFSENEIRAAVETWVRYVTADARPDAIIEKMEPYEFEGRIVAYIAHLQGGGFCLCGTNDLVLPVYFYSSQGIYDPQDPNYQYFLWEIATRTKYSKQQVLEERESQLFLRQEALSERAALWQNLIAGRVSEKRLDAVPTGMELKLSAGVAPTGMELELTSRWHQGSPYNAQCPQLTPGTDEHAIVGCPATAMSQIMYYWKWPNTGVGSGSTTYHYRWSDSWIEKSLESNPNIQGSWNDRLQWTPTDGGKLRINGFWDESLYETAQKISTVKNYLSTLEDLWDDLKRTSSKHAVNFGTAQYDWNVMRDWHGSWTDGNDEVSELCYHAGVSMGMKYGIEGSGAPSEDVDNALRDHFRYEASHSSRNVEKMIEEIQWLRPVELCGWRDASKNSNPTGKEGHCWVVLGYDQSSDASNPQFKMNMGWGGAAGWYTIDTAEGFTIDQDHVFRIAPRDMVKFIGDDNPGNGTPNDPYEDIEEAINEAPNGVTLIFKAGSVNTFSVSTLTIDRPFTLKGENVIIQRR